MNPHDESQPHHKGISPYVQLFAAIIKRAIIDYVGLGNRSTRQEHSQHRDTTISTHTQNAARVYLFRKDRLESILHSNGFPPSYIAVIRHQALQRQRQVNQANYYKRLEFDNTQ